MVFAKERKKELIVSKDEYKRATDNTSTPTTTTTTTATFFVTPADPSYCCD